MTPDDLDRIEERLAKADPNSDWYTANEWYAARATLADKDVPALIAEVRRLAADLLVQQSQAHDLMSQIEGEAWAALAEWRDRAEKAEAALDRVRALCGQPGVRGAVWTADIRAAIDPEATP